MLKTKQIILLGSVAILMGILYSLDIKGLIKPKDNQGMQNTATAENKPVAEVSAESVFSLSKQMISANLVTDIEKVEKEIKNVSGEEYIKLQINLAKKWDDVNQPAAAAFVYEAVATEQSTYANWLITGDRFTDGYQNYRDTAATPGLLNRAINAYNKALELNPKSLDAKTGLGVAYVSGTQNLFPGR